jgi:hypothetical protein
MRHVALPGARSPADATLLDELPRGWVELHRKATGRELRHSQASILKKVAEGHDIVGIAATGSGKSTTWNLPAAVDRCTTLDGSTPTRLDPVHLVIIPLAGMGDEHETESCDFLMSACGDRVPTPSEGTPRCYTPRALFVNRAGLQDQGASTPQAPPSRPVCGRGHELRVLRGRHERSQQLATCDSCFAPLEINMSRAQCRDTQASSTPCDYDMCMACYETLSTPSAATPLAPGPADTTKPDTIAPPPLPKALPCGVCKPCADPASTVVEANACRWTCRVWWPASAPRPEWCDNCFKAQSWKRCTHNALSAKRSARPAPNPRRRR